MYQASVKRLLFYRGSWDGRITRTGTPRGVARCPHSTRDRGGRRGDRAGRVCVNVATRLFTVVSGRLAPGGSVVGVSGRGVSFHSVSRPGTRTMPAPRRPRAGGTEGRAFVRPGGRVGRGLRGASGAPYVHWHSELYLAACLRSAVHCEHQSVSATGGNARDVTSLETTMMVGGRKWHSSTIAPSPSTELAAE